MVESSVIRRHAREARSRSRSPSVVSLPDLGREDPEFKYTHLVRRSFTPSRETLRSASLNYLAVDPEQEYSRAKRYSGLREYSASIYNPFFKITDAVEQQPLRKYDVFSMRTWSYPVWKYINNPPGRRYRYYTSYTPPLMTFDYKQYAPSRRGYSGYSYLAGDSLYYMADVDRSIRSAKYWHSAPSTQPWYRSYYGHSNLRHFGGYRRVPYYCVRPTWFYY